MKQPTFCNNCNQISKKELCDKCEAKMMDRQPSKPIFTLEDVEEILGQPEDVENPDGMIEAYEDNFWGEGRNYLRKQQRQRLSEKLESYE